MRNGRSGWMYLSIWKEIKEFSVIKQTYHFSNSIQKIMTQTAVNFNSIYRGNYLFNQYGFRSNSLSTDNIINIRQTP